MVEFNISLSQFDNIHNFDEEKRKREGEKPNELFATITEDNVKFEPGRKPKPTDENQAK